jgi:hypothetical protein
MNIPSIPDAFLFFRPLTRMYRGQSHASGVRHEVRQDNQSPPSDATTRPRRMAISRHDRGRNDRALWLDSELAEMLALS